MEPIVYISGFTYELGENDYALEELAELSSDKKQIEGLRKGGFDRYRTSDSSVLDLAGKAVDKTLMESSIKPEEVDAVIFATSAFGTNSHLTHNELCSFLVSRGLINAYPVSSSLSFCGNFMPALKTAYNGIVSGSYHNVLVVVSDIIPKASSKLTPPDIAVGSDASACCVLSASKISRFRISNISLTVNAKSGLMDPDKDFLHYTKLVGQGIRSTVSKSFDSTILKREDITKVFTNNYSKTVCHGFLRLIDIPEEKLFADNIPRFGHAGAADICINLHDYLNDQFQETKNNLFLLSTGPFMWGSAIINSVD